MLRLHVSYTLPAYIKGVLRTALQTDRHVYYEGIYMIMLDSPCYLVRLMRIYKEDKKLRKRIIVLTYVLNLRDLTTLNDLFLSFRQLLAKLSKVVASASTYAWSWRVWIPLLILPL